MLAPVEPQKTDYSKAVWILLAVGFALAIAGWFIAG